MSSSGIQITIEDLIRLKSEAKGFSLQTRQPSGSILSGRHSSRLRGRGLTFEELRQYHQGDDIRTIDWRATARLKSAHVRVYSEERDRPVLFVVDQRNTMFFGSRRAMKSVTAAELAALGTWKALTTGDRVGGIVFNNQSIRTIRPRRSQNQAMQLFHEIARMNQMLAENSSTKETVTFNDALTAARQAATHDHLIVIISDLEEADQLTAKLVTRMAAHNDVVVAAVFDPLGASIHSHPGMKARTPEGEISIPTDKQFAVNFQKAFEKRLDEWTQIFRKIKIPILPISTAEPPALQLRHLIGGQPYRQTP